MSPQDRLEFEKLKQTVQNLQRVEDVAFIASLIRQLSIDSKISAAVSQISIGDLVDVDISSPTNGQVIKYTTSGVDRWINGTDLDT